ncbi:hypothetical protein HAV15_002416 [Penicillium sp. str. |nr:hypothetical protein HAV15_002416 [Penicillium sp. str. \
MADEPRFQELLNSPLSKRDVVFVLEIRCDKKLFCHCRPPAQPSPSSSETTGQSCCLSFSLICVTKALLPTFNLRSRHCKSGQPLLAKNPVS